MPPSLTRHSLAGVGSLVPAFGRLGIAMVVAASLLGLATPPAQAATTRTTTRSCTDAGGVTWHTKVVWGNTYVSAGVTKVVVDRASWTTTLGSVPTDSDVRTYDGSGRLAKKAVRTSSVDYRQGTVEDGRNPTDPPSGGAKVVITLGRDGDGFAGCTVTHRQSDTADPIVAAAGDMVCPTGAQVTATTCRQKAVSDSIVAARPAAFLALGDNQYDSGSLAEFKRAYQPSYGRLRAITSPIPGNHEYYTAGADGYFDYFGTAAGLRSKGYYAQDIGAWHVTALNSERDISTGGAQLAWLKKDLAAHKNACTMAILHKPRFSTGNHGSNAAMKPFFDALVAARAELVLSGHDHDYERFPPQTGAGALSSSGVTQVVVGTGGKELNGRVSKTANAVVRSQDGPGWLKLTLHPTSVDLHYVGVAGNPFTDRKTISCR